MTEENLIILKIQALIRLVANRMEKDQEQCRKRFETIVTEGMSEREDFGRHHA